MANAETKKRPGIMLYFETIRNCTKRLDFEEKGRLFDAILAYGEDGTLPDFSEEEDLSLCIAWDVIRPQIDNDNLRYQEKCQMAQNAARARWSD